LVAGRGAGKLSGGRGMKLTAEVQNEWSYTSNPSYLMCAQGLSEYFNDPSVGVEHEFVNCLETELCCCWWWQQ